MQMLLKHFEKIMKDMPPEARNAPAFQIQNVAEWVLPERGSWNTQKNLLTVAPPYNYIWMEYAGFRAYKTFEWGKGIGVLLASLRLTDSDRDWFESRLSGYTMKPRPSWKSCEGGWFVACRVYHSNQNNCRFSGLVEVVVRSDGQIATPEHRYFFSDEIVRMGGRFDESVAIGVLIVPVYVCLAAITLMHLKNIQRVPITVPPKVREKRKKRGIPDIRFETLAIEPFRQRFQREYEKNPNGPSSTELAFHLVRGHFKDYRERGLFGNPNLRGIYWWDSHARGNEKNGIIIKDYEVKTQ